jgi:hypothetical protein
LVSINLFRSLVALKRRTHSLNTLLSNRPEQLLIQFSVTHSNFIGYSIRVRFLENRCATAQHQTSIHLCTPNYCQRLCRANCHHNHQSWTLISKKPSSFLHANVHESITLSPCELQHEKSMENPLRHLVPWHY